MLVRAHLVGYERCHGAAEVRELVAAPKGDEQRHAPESLIAQAEQAVARTWRGGGQWLGRRFAELFKNDKMMKKVLKK